MTKNIFLSLFIVCLIFYIGFIAFNKQTVKQQTFYAMGTNLTISIAQENVDDEIFKQAFETFKNVETTFKSNLDLNNKEVQAVLKQGLDLQEKTNDVFSVYLGDVISLWQFDKTNKTISQVPTDQQLETALKAKSINLYSIAKGYGIDKVAENLKQNGINNFIVNAGGDLFISGKKFGKRWKIGLNDTNNYIKCRLDTYALATSSNLYNYYNFNGKKYGHLLNGVTGKPVATNKSITVLAKSATIADGLATAVFVDEALINKQDGYEFSTIKKQNDSLTTYNLNNRCKIW